MKDRPLLGQTLWIVAKIVDASPLWLRNLFCEILTFIWWDLLGLRKVIVYRNLRLAFRDLTREQRLQLGRRSIFHLVGNVIDTLMVPAMDAAWVKRKVEMLGEEKLREALKLNKGVLVLGMHTDNGDTAVANLALRGFPLSLITKRFKTQWVDDLWFAIRRKPGASYIEAHGDRTPYEILGALKKKELVIFVLDQQMGPPYGVKTKFFGRTTGTAYGLALFAIRTGAPVLPVFLVRKDDWTYRMVVEDPVTWSFPEEWDRDRKVAELTQILTNRIEAIVKQWPESWMWVHRRWKDFY